MQRVHPHLQKDAHLQILNKVLQQITSILDINELLTQVVRLIQNTLAYYHVGIGMIEGDEVVYRVGAGVLWDAPGFQYIPSRLKIGTEGITGWVAKTGETALVSDVSLDPRYVWMQGSLARSELTVPITVKGNHDGLWVFAKVRGTDGRWRHLKLDAAEAAAGFTAERSADGMGAFLFRAVPGNGDARTRLTLRWQASENLRALRLFAWPMVHVPEGAFDAGDGNASTPGRFHDGGDAGRPFRVTAAPIALAPRAGALWADDRRWPLPSGALGPSPWDGVIGTLPTPFPTGFRGFWIQPYELTQGRYANIPMTMNGP